MSTITGWLIGILSVVLLGTVADLLLSESKTGKYIRSVFAAVTVLVIILPIPSLVQNGFRFDSGFIIQNELVLDENYLSYANRVKLAYLARGVEEQLRQDGVLNVSVAIEGTVSPQDIKIQLVRLNFKNAVIDEKTRHIYEYERVKQLVAEYLKIEKGRIIVDG